MTAFFPTLLFFADLPSELEAFNEFAKAVQDIPFLKSSFQS